MSPEEPQGPEVELIRSAYAAWDFQDLGPFIEQIAEDAEWVPPSYAPEAGPHRGREAIKRGLESYREGFEEFRPVPQRIIRGGRPGRYLVLATTFTRGKGSGVETTIDVGHVIDVREGKLARLEVHPDLEDAYRAAGLDPPAETRPAT